ncbi:MAG: hypothetical protein ABWY19_00865 [Marmoricola sp.]
MSAIAWTRLTQPEFDRLVEALFMAEHKDIPRDTFVVTGRGGDKGIGIHIRRDGRLIIVQLKSFPKGFRRLREGPTRRDPRILQDGVTACP